MKARVDGFRLKAWIHVVRGGVFRCREIARSDIEGMFVTPNSELGSCWG